MLEKLMIKGQRPLDGEITVSGSKNAALPILAATLLSDGECVLRNVPRLRDTLTMIKLLKSLGKKVDVKDDVIVVSPAGPIQPVADYKLVSTMRGSFCVLGPLLAKLGQAKVSLPGGCIIGIRPVDLHLKGIRALGAKIDIDAGYILARARRLKGCNIYLGGVFGSSVLATANVMMAAALAKGETVIECAACEPEIVELADFLNAMGARVMGQGSPQILIEGVSTLQGCEYDVGPDRIEAGTYMMLAGMLRSTLTLKNMRIRQLLAVVDKLEQVGLRFEYPDDTTVVVKSRKRLNPVSVTTYAYPGFPTDLQAQFIALMSTVPGISVVTDKIFPDRFMHIAELNRMGAGIRREGSNAIIEGVRKLHGAPIMASDLRASAALVLAGLAAEGETEVHRIYHLDRGYENLDQKLSAVGAQISREKE